MCDRVHLNILLYTLRSQAKQDVFAYPWTVHTNRPQRILEYGYKQGQVRPPSAVTAPPFALYTKKEPRPQVKEPPPHTAPVKKTSAPLLSSDPSDRRLRRAERQRLAPLPEDEADEISPFDSVSQVSPMRTHRSPSLRLRTVDQQTRRRVDTELRMASRNRALSTPPRPRPLLDNEGFPQTPTRIFKGEYIDPSELLPFVRLFETCFDFNLQNHKSKTLTTTNSKMNKSELRKSKG